jgi:hypothetical protein
MLFGNVGMEYLEWNEGRRVRYYKAVILRPAQDDCSMYEDERTLSLSMEV